MSRRKKVYKLVKGFRDFRSLTIKEDSKLSLHYKIGGVTKAYSESTGIAVFKDLDSVEKFITVKGWKEFTLLEAKPLGRQRRATKILMFPSTLGSNYSNLRLLAAFYRSRSKKGFNSVTAPPGTLFYDRILVTKNLGVAIDYVNKSKEC